MSRDAAELNQPTDPTSRKPHGPVLGVTRYDRVVALLLSLILTGGTVAAGFGVIWASNQQWKWLRAKPAIPLQWQPIADVLGGGDPSGTLDVLEEGQGPEGPVTVAPADPDAVTADNSPLQETVAAVLAHTGAAVQFFDEFAFGSDGDPWLLASSNRKGSRQHKPLGDGPGPGGGVPRSQRWEIIFEPGQTEAEYARQLDYFKVRLGVLVDGRLYEVSQLASPAPRVTHVADPREEKDLYFSWRGGSRRLNDLNLLRKAKDVPLASNVIVLQFYPHDAVQALAHIERDYATEHGVERMERVRKTRFTVKKAGDVYAFDIVKQDYFREASGQ